MQEQSPVPSDFAARVRAARAYGNMSQADLARELGMSPGYVKMVENGKGLKDLEARSLLERLPEVTGLPRSFFVGEQVEADAAKIDVILAAVLDMQEKLNQRYDQLGEIVRERHEMERRIRHLTAEEADEIVRMLAEARMRQGRDIGLRSSQAGHATDRQTGS